MTGYRSASLRHNCDRHGCYIALLPCWDDIIARLPRHIKPTDIDGMVEINDHFLFLEEKRKGAGPDEGQRLALLRLSRRERITVVFIRPARTSDMEALVFDGHPPCGWQQWTREYFLDWVEAWAIRADLRAPADLRSNQ